MGRNWKSSTLSKLGRIVTGKTPSSSGEGYFGGKIPFVTPTDFDGRRIIINTGRYLTDDGAKAVAGARIKPRSVMVTCIGSDMGKAAIAGRDCVTNQQINSILVGDDNDPLYVYYNLSGRKEEIRSHASGSAQPILNKSGFGALEITLPPLREQQAIACILGAFDDKIELNRQMNRTLEEMARAIFKSWFVDFDPIRAKAAGHEPPGLKPEIAALFPDTFEDSELGQIPRGWRVGAMGDIATQTIGGQWGADGPTVGLAPAICLRGCDMEDLRQSGAALSAPVRYTKPTAIESRLPCEKDLLIAASGAGPCGRPLWCAPEIARLYDVPVIYSNFVKRFSTPSCGHAIYLDRILIQKFEDRSIGDFITGTSVPNLDSTGLLSGCLILLPPSEVIEAFTRYCLPIYARLYSKVNLTLATIRDTLLPQLISSALQVPDAERIAARCT